MLYAVNKVHTSLIIDSFLSAHACAMPDDVNTAAAVTPSLKFASLPTFPSPIHCLVSISCQQGVLIHEENFYS